MANANWHAVHTKLHCEQRVASLLTRKHIKNYCPIHEKEILGSEGKKTILAPLFTSIVFVYIRDEEHIVVKNTSSVVNFVYWLNKPAIITVGEIDAIRVVLKNYTHVSLESFPLKMLGDEMIDTSLLVQQLDLTGTTIKLKLPSLGYYIHGFAKKGSFH